MKEEINGCAAGCDACAGCGHDHFGSELPDDISPIVTLTDEDGNDVKFEIIDVVVLEDEREFLIVAEADREESDENVEVNILEIKEADEFKKKKLYYAEKLINLLKKENLQIEFINLSDSI